MINKYFSYKELFLEDIVKSIEFSIGLSRDNEQNIEIENINGNFEEYFVYKNCTYLRYDFLEVVANLIMKVIQKGNENAIIVKYKDEEKNIVKGLEIHIPFYKFKLYGFKYVYFIQKQNTIGLKKYHIKKVKKDEVIKITSKDFNINRFKMRKILKRLENADMSYKLIRLLEKNLLYNGEFEEIREKEKINLFRYTKDIKWDARDYWSDYLNSPYILYRNVEFYKYLINLLNITINIINQRISEQKDVINKRKYKSKN